MRARQAYSNDINERLLEKLKISSIYAHIPCPQHEFGENLFRTIPLHYLQGKKDFLSKLKAFVPSGSVYPSLSTTVKQGRSGASLVV